MLTRRGWASKAAYSIQLWARARASPRLKFAACCCHSHRHSPSASRAVPKCRSPTWPPQVVCSFWDVKSSSRIHNSSLRCWFGSVPTSQNYHSQIAGLILCFGATSPPQSHQEKLETGKTRRVWDWCRCGAGTRPPRLGRGAAPAF